MNSNQQKTDAVLEIRAVVSRYPWRLVLPAFGVMALVLVGSLFLPRKYRAEATFDRRTDMVLSEIMNRGAPRTFQDPRQSLVEELAGEMSCAKLTQTIDLAKLGMPDSPAFRARLKARISRKIIVTMDVTTAELDRVRLAYIDENPAIAQAVVNGLVQNYIDQTRENMTRNLNRSSQFFKEQVKESRNRIDKLESVKLEFELKNGELLPENPGNLNTSLTEAQHQLNDLKRQLETSKLKSESLKLVLQNTPEESPSIFTSRNPEKLAMESKLVELKSQMTNFIGVFKMTDKHPELIAVRQQIAQLETAIAKLPDEVVTQKQTLPNTKYAEIQLQLTTSLAEASSLERQIAQTQDLVARLTESASKVFPVRNDYRKLTREVDQAQRQLSFWEDNLRSVNLSLAADNGDRGVKLEFIQPCGEINRPISPNLTQVIVAALGLGIISGGLSLFFAHRTEQRIHDGEEMAEAFNLPLLGAVSEITTAKERASRRLRALVLYPLGIVGMAVALLVLAGLLYLSLERSTAKISPKTSQTSAVQTQEQQPVAAAPEE